MARKSKAQLAAEGAAAATESRAKTRSSASTSTTPATRGRGRGGRASRGSRTSTTAVQISPPTTTAAKKAPRGRTKRRPFNLSTSSESSVSSPEVIPIDSPKFPPVGVIRDANSKPPLKYFAPRVVHPPVVVAPLAAPPPALTRPVPTSVPLKPVTSSIAQNDTHTFQTPSNPARARSVRKLSSLDSPADPSKAPYLELPMKQTQILARNLFPVVEDDENCSPIRNLRMNYLATDDDDDEALEAIPKRDRKENIISQNINSQRPSQANPYRAGRLPQANPDFRGMLELLNQATAAKNDDDDDSFLSQEDENEDAEPYQSPANLANVSSSQVIICSEDMFDDDDFSDFMDNFEIPPLKPEPKVPEPVPRVSLPPTQSNQTFSAQLVGRSAHQQSTPLPNKVQSRLIPSTATLAQSKTPFSAKELINNHLDDDFGDDFADDLDFDNIPQQALQQAAQPSAAGQPKVQSTSALSMSSYDLDDIDISDIMPVKAAKENNKCPVTIIGNQVKMKLPIPNMTSRRYKILTFEDLVNMGVCSLTPEKPVDNLQLE